MTGLDVAYDQSDFPKYLLSIISLICVGKSLPLTEKNHRSKILFVLDGVSCLEFHHY